MERLTLEMAEAKLLGSLSNLVWIIPSLVVFENIMAYYFFEATTWTSSGTISVLTTVLWMVIILKIISVVERQINAERERRIEKDKLIAQRSRQ